ncbi:MAG: hypothetical protein JSV54_08600, partial [Chloroflexota bacterium]
MMGYAARAQPIMLVSLSAILLPFLLLTSGCVADTGTYYQVDNRTDQILEIFIENLPHCDAPPEEVSRCATMEIRPNPVLVPPDYKYSIKASTKE